MDAHSVPLPLSITKPLPALFGLSRALHQAIFTFLSFKDKLISCSHVHRFLLPLSPSIFRQDCLELHATVIDNLSSSPPLLSLLSHVSAISFHQRSGDGLALIDSVIRLLSPLSLFPTSSSPFSQLQTLTLDNIVLNASSLLCQSCPDPQAVLFPSSSAFPFLRSLTIRHRLADYHLWPPLSVSFVSSLHRLPSLATLSLTVLLDAISVVTVLLLPLHELDLTGCGIAPAADATALSTSVALISSSSHSSSSSSLKCRVLRLPWRVGDCAVINLALAEYARAAAHTQSGAIVCVGDGSDDDAGIGNGIGSGTGTAGDAAGGSLQALYVTGYLVSAFTLSLVARITSLTSLHVSNFFSQDRMSALFDAACGSGLPHLHTVSFPVKVSGRQEEADVNLSCLHFLHQFAPQLHHIELHRFEFHYAPIQQLMAHLLACTRLQTLTLRGGLRANNNRHHEVRLPTHLSTLPELRSLHIDGPLFDNTALISLLSSCPALEHIKLSECRLTTGVLPALGQCCRRLISVWMASESTWMFSQKLAIKHMLAALREPPDPPTTTTTSINTNSECVYTTESRCFSSLQSLHLHQYSKLKLRSPSRACHSVIPALFHSAPLHSIHLTLQYEPAQLRVFSPFTSLRSLSLLMPTPTDAATIERFCADNTKEEDRKEDNRTGTSRHDNDSMVRYSFDRRDSRTSFFAQVNRLPLLPAPQAEAIPPSLPNLHHLLHLHVLRLDGKLNIEAADLHLLFASCSALDDCHLDLRWVRGWSVALLPVIARHCSLLRRLWLMAGSDRHFHSVDAVLSIVEQVQHNNTVTVAASSLPLSMNSLSSSSSSRARPVWFPHLRFFRLDCQYRWKHERRRPQCALLPVLPLLLRSAPLVYLHVGLRYQYEELSLWSSFRHLRVLSIRDPNHLILDQLRRFCDYYVLLGSVGMEWATRVSNGSTGVVAAEEEQWREQILAEYRFRQISVFVFNEKRQFAGKDGREAFFDQVAVDSLD